ncbi:MAG TPA: response regulator, partial [Anaerolineales bacterium]|nr:response regulator [Anaerolineales bacterium]
MEKPFALIIDDDRDIAALFRHVLDIAGYHTEVEMHGLEAVKHLDSVRPDIVLLDLHLPGVSGMQILERIRADERLRTVPVVVVTAYSQDADSLPVEPDLVLLKPVNLDQLSSLVQRLRATPGSVRETPWDKITHLYNRSFFTLRLNYSLERAKQIGDNRFGVLFVELNAVTPIPRLIDESPWNEFLHEIAVHLKTVLRPTDTISRFNERLFLILLEDVSNEEVPERIARRVSKELGDYLRQKYTDSALQVCAGVVLCNAAYESSNEILADVDLARKLARHAKGKVLYDRDALLTLRGSFLD